jgi:hypothetical protein
MEPPWTFHEVNLHAAVLEGPRLLIELKMYLYAGSEEVFVSADDIARAMFSHQRNVQVWKLLRRQRDVWQEVCEQLGLDFNAEFRPSKRLARCLPEEFSAPCEKTRSCQTVSVRLLILWLLHNGVHSHRVMFRRIAACMLRATLVAFTDGQCNTTQEFSELRAEAGAGCDCQDLDGCVFARHRLIISVLEAGDRREVLQGMMEKCAQALYHCAFARKVLLRYVALVERAFLSTLESGALRSDKEGHKVEVAARKTGGRRKAEDTYRAAMVSSLLKRRRLKNTKALLRADGWHRSTHSRWVRSNVAAYVWSSRQQLGLNCDDCTGSWVLREDATRIGNPSKETLVAVISKQTHGGSAVMAPQADRGGNDGAKRDAGVVLATEWRMRVPFPSRGVRFFSFRVSTPLL